MEQAVNIHVYMRKVPCVFLGIWDELETGTAKDEMLQAVMQAISKGGKNKISHLPIPTIKIAFSDLRSAQIVVPAVMGKEILESIHEGHLVMTK